jgi:orotate phosphoribosyltransferase
MRNQLNTEIKELAFEIGALLYGSFNLSAGGKKSSFYFDGRMLTLDPKGSYLVAKAILPLVASSGAEAIAGPTLGADPIVAAVSMLSHIEENQIPGLIVRNQPKSHGTQKLIEGNLTPGLKVAVVDDTCSSGKSIFHAVAALEKAECEITAIFSILDRNEGGSEEIKKQGYKFDSLLFATPEGEIIER